ncbi:helicase-related protein [Kribbella sp. NPDC051587]|uniref:helicase-related protein n=1 Tax=Kribbella sp. NPDC051587 TaxID=3364119 RepID=UPI003792461A
MPQIFDDSNAEFSAERSELRGLLSDTEWNAAARTTINAHYTDPAYVEAIWSALTTLGFTGGQVLEPGSGSGTFIGLAPANAKMTGVELDPITARIAAKLYPGSDIRAESFADTRISGRFDAVVGNVPFADVRLTDRVHNPSGAHSMHNHFIIKSLALTKPGGIVAVLTSRYTLDSQNPAARRELAELGDMIGAVRLPAGAHRRTAGTDVVTDLIVLRRREPGRAPDADSQRWLDTAANLELDGSTHRVNKYFLERPNRVLGQFAVGRGMYGEELVVRGDGDTAMQLSGALHEVVFDGVAKDLRWTADAEEHAVVQAAAQIGGTDGLFVGHITKISDTEFTEHGIDGAAVPLPVPSTQAAELGQLLQLRDTVIGLLRAEAANLDDTAEIGQLRADLNRLYDAYQAAHGPLNRSKGRPWVDKKGNDRVTWTRPPVMRLFGRDPFSATVFALEEFEPATQTATKADILTQRVIAPRRPVLGADTPADAVAISLDTHGEPRLDTLAKLLGVDEAAARESVRGLVFEDPELQRLVPAAEYLSGNVRQKLATAIAAAEEDEQYSENVTALREVLPEDLPPSRIHAQLGAAWIGADDVQAFLREILDDRRVTVEHVIGSQWKIDGGQYGVNATTEWGTTRYPAGKLAQHVLRQSQIRVVDVIDEREVFNPVETEAAQEKANQLNERFSEWVWEDPERASRLHRVYNDTFNSLVLRSYDTDRLSLPGLVETFEPRPHQLAAVARMIAEPTVGLFHEVGAGKTAEMVMGVTELRRLGLVRKPAIVVPNHMLEQFSREFLQLYPQARILAAGTEDLVAAKRRQFVARVATGNWDAVILTRTAFENLPVSRATLETYLDNEITPLRKAVADMRAGGGDNRTVKQAEKSILNAEERVKKKMDQVKDPGVSFEETGIDYLCVDELHDYKNLLTPSSIQDAAITPGSNRASDLHMKVEYLRARYNGRAFTGATATPIANSISEAYVMQRLVRPDLLTDAGITDFDTWAGTFGKLVTKVELAPDATSWRLKTRFAKFRNLRALQRMWHTAGDVKLADDLDLDVPALVERPDGKRLPQVVVVEPSDEVLDYVRDLGRRAENIQNKLVDPDQDNMLKVSSDGRAAALDMRLINRDDYTGRLPLTDLSKPPKVARVADEVARRWMANRDRIYETRSGEPHAVPGALQMVFCDLGTPRDTWNVYSELLDQLVARGVPGEQIEFIHSAKNDRQKATLFEAARTGRVQVLIGSTSKMGVGTNVQTRAIALHHVDCPWRPADITQRDGRGVRQGNQNDEIEVLRYVTEGTFDAYSWQTIERKAGFIGQFLSARDDLDEIEDVGEMALSATEITALSSGNPLLMEKAAAEAEVGRLARLERAHGRTQSMLEHRINDHTRQIAASHNTIGDLETAIALRVDTRGDKFRMEVAGIRYNERADAAAAFANQLAGVMNRRPGTNTTTRIGELGGFELTAERFYREEVPHAVVRFTGGLIDNVSISLNESQNPSPGLVVRLENAVRTLDRKLSGQHEYIDELTTEISRARDQVGQPFKYRAELDAAYATRKSINDQLSEAAKPVTPAAEATAVEQQPDSLAARARQHVHDQAQPHQPAPEQEPAHRPPTHGLTH